MARRKQPRAPDRSARAAGGDRPRAQLAVALGLLVLIAAVYAPVAGHEFVGLDDAAHFTANPNLDGRFEASDLAAAFRPYYANWIPLTWLSIAVDDALFGAAPAGVLIENVAWHALATLLLYLAMLRMTGARVASAFVAAVFAVHPLHVESVAWASGRKDVLSGVGWMAAMLAYARYRERPSAGRYAALFASAACAMLAKPVAVTLPFALLLLDVWPLARFGDGLAAWRRHGAELRAALLEKLPLFALSALVSALTMAAQTGAGADQSVQVPLAYRVLNAGGAYGAYLVDSFWPSGLAAHYPYTPESLLGPAVVGAGLGVVLVTGLCFGLAASRPYLFTGWLWFLGTLVPMIGFVHVGSQARADRYTYLPLVGLAWAVAFAARSFAHARPAARRPLLAAAAASVLALGVAAHQQVRTWRDSETLFLHATAVTRDNAFAHTALGALYRERGDTKRAERHLDEALRIRPGSAEARTDLALLRIDQGRIAEGRAALQAALAEGGDAAKLRTALGLAAERSGDLAAAIEHYRAALRANPQRREAANNLAWLLATVEDTRLRDPAEAVAIAERIAPWNAGDPSVLDTLAAAYAAAGRSKDAIAAQTRALAALPPGPSPLRDQLEERMQQYRAQAR